MKLRRIVLGGLSALMLISLASCSNKAERSALYGYYGGEEDDVFTEVFEKGLNRRKNSLERNEDTDIKFRYSVKWSSGWDKEFEDKDFEEDEWKYSSKNDEEGIDTGDKNAELVKMVCTIKLNDEGEKAEVTRTIYFVNDSHDKVLYPAGGKIVRDGDSEDMELYEVESFLYKYLDIYYNSRIEI